MESDLQEARQNLAAASIDLLVTVGLLSSVLQKLPETVRDNFEEKIRIVTVEIAQATDEFMSFGEAYDEEASDGEG